MDLTNKLSEEEAIRIFKISEVPYSHIPDYIIALKQANIVRKSAREELFKTLKQHKQIAKNHRRTDLVYVYEELEILIDAALKEEAERAERK